MERTVFSQLRMGEITRSQDSYIPSFATPPTSHKSDMSSDSDSEITSDEHTPIETKYPEPPDFISGAERNKKYKLEDGGDGSVYTATDGSEILMYKSDGKNAMLDGDLSVDESIDIAYETIRKLGMDTRVTLLMLRQDRLMVEEMLNTTPKAVLEASCAGIESEKNLRKLERMADTREILDLMETQLEGEEYIKSGIYLFYMLPRQYRIMDGMRRSPLDVRLNMDGPNDRIHKTQVRLEDAERIGGFPGRVALTEAQRKEQIEALYKEDQSRAEPFFSVNKVDELLDLGESRWLAELSMDASQSRYSSSPYGDLFTALRGYDLERIQTNKEADKKTDEKAGFETQFGRAGVDYAKMLYHENFKVDNKLGGEKANVQKADIHDDVGCDDSVHCHDGRSSDKMKNQKTKSNLFEELAKHGYSQDQFPHIADDQVDYCLI